jgi:regulator of protease activity HflC (stomatin/prohibitin superfamily)
MGEFGIVVVVLFVFVAVTIAKGVRIVPQGEEWIVERLGKFHATLRPGLNIIVPYFDQVRYKLTTKDIILDVQEQEVITKDNAVILTNAIAFIKITDPIKAVYGVTDFSEAIRNMIMTTLRSIIGEMTLDEALVQSRQDQGAPARGRRRRSHRLGLTVKSVEIQDINPSESMQKAMEAQASAERERKAMVTKAEGTKQATILNAEAQLQAARLSAEAQVTLAEASAEAIKRVAVAIGAEDAPMRYMLGEKYIHAIGNLAKSDNAKTVLIPADIQETLRGILGSRK